MAWGLGRNCFFYVMPFKNNREISHACPVLFDKQSLPRINKYLKSSVSSIKFLVIFFRLPYFMFDFLFRFPYIFSAYFNFLYHILFYVIHYYYLSLFFFIWLVCLSMLTSCSPFFRLALCLSLILLAISEYSFFFLIF